MQEQLELMDSRRAFLRASLLSMVGVASGAASTAAFALSAPPTRAALGGGAAGFRERRVMHGGHGIYVRDYPGDGLPFVMVHGLPDNCRIYEDVAPLLSAAGRRVIAFDFLGFGSSDKPAGFRYDFNQQRADLAAVIADLGPGPVIPVAHDAGGPAAINFALDHQSKVAGLVLLNCYYANSPVLRFPEFVELCADPSLAALGRAMMSDAVQAAWLLHETQDLFMAGATPGLRAHFDAKLKPIVNDNFANAPSSGPAFLAMTGDAVANLAYNSSRLAELRRFAPPVKLIWGVQDPYFNKAVADDMASHFARARFTGIAANHWPQIDSPEAVAQALLA